MNVAIVYDRVNKFGGAEQILLALHELFPDAPLFTSVYSQSGAPWADVFHVTSTFLQRIPFARRHHELFPWATPIAFETLSFDSYDVVLSVTSAEAKTIITKPDTLHICYCLTPTRYLWSGYETYASQKRSIAKIFLKLFVHILRNWDFYGSKRPDVYVAISQLVSERVQTYYHQIPKAVIYPPVDTELFTNESIHSTLSQPLQTVGFLCVGRLVHYKRMDLLIHAFNQLNLPLTIIGNGKELKWLKKIAKENIRFVTQKLTADELRAYYQQCIAFVFVGEEDFGIVAAEAQSCGKPVICYKKSGMAEIVEPGKTGEYFEKQSVDEIVCKIQRFRPEKYSEADCHKQAMRFSKRLFKQSFRTFVESEYEDWVKRRKNL